MGWRSLLQWVSEHLAPAKQQQPAEVVKDVPQTGKVRVEDGQPPLSKLGTAEAEDLEQAPRTQFSGHPKEEIDLVIGLDFGTLSTRVVVRSPFVAGGRAVPVRWRVRPGLPPHFLPAALHESSNGEFALTPDWNELQDGNLKVDLMDRPDDSVTRARAAAYLGLTLREARGYVLDTQAEAYGRSRLRWAVHVGIPSAGYDDDDVKGAFLCVARAAWMLSRRSESPTLETALAALKGAANTAGIKEDQDVTGVEVFPEIAALVVGYARSRRRRAGLHVMMDVGGSTIDICGFGLLDDDGDDSYQLFTALVERIGIRELHQKRMDAIRHANTESLLRVPALLDPFSEVPAAGSEYVSTPSNPLCAEFQRLDKRYVEDCTNALMKVIVHLKRSRDPHSEAWTTGLSLFKAGGGAQHRLVAHAVDEANRRLANLLDAKGIDEKYLETLVGLDWSPEDGGQDGASGETPRDHGLVDPDTMAGRLGVAYGLGFDKFEIGEIVPPHDIDDVPPMPLRRLNEYTSKDHV